MTKLQVAGKLIATLRGEEQQNILNDALKAGYTWDELEKAVNEYKKTTNKGDQTND